MLSTVLAGLALAAPNLHTSSNVAIVLTTAVAGLATSIEGLRKPGELWIHERTLYYALKDLKRKLEFCTAEDHDLKVVDTIFSEMQDVLGSARERWSRQVAGKAGKESSDGSSGTRGRVTGVIHLHDWRPLRASFRIPGRRWARERVAACLRPARQPPGVQRAAFTLGA